MWTEMPKLGWMSSSQTQTISKFPWLRNSHITFESKSSRGKGTSQCGTEGATSAYQGSEFDVFFVFYVWRILWCVYAVLTCHHIKRQGLAAQLTSAAWWQTSNWYNSGVQWSVLFVRWWNYTILRVFNGYVVFFPQLFTRQHCVQATCC